MLLEFKAAQISADKQYRYSLTRSWRETSRYVMFIGLNPSTANATEDDPTIRRCKRFASDWGYGSMIMTNLFALRATNPKVMLAHDAPVGEENNTYLRDLASRAGIIVCAWGAHGGLNKRDEQVMGMLHQYNLKCLGTTKAGKPKHPLYLRADTPLITFREPMLRKHYEVV